VTAKKNPDNIQNVFRGAAKRAHPNSKVGTLQYLHITEKRGVAGFAEKNIIAGRLEKQPEKLGTAPTYLRTNRGVALPQEKEVVLTFQQKPF